ncbi:hypothetical protein GGX14DRAFT_444507 [Mycena pura]|uniref:Uncharacterized protein n=1 Tax=Mycena pura TaxID=153505 RepID=A0AAD6VID5_9AGAR|nr:hypothetical protein GGX14DRAFT_444507 [Mycena pura]
MPPLSTSAASASLFSPKALAGLVVFIVTVLGVAGLLWVVSHVSRNLAKRRVCVSDIEARVSCFTGSTRHPNIDAKKNAAARTLMCARAKLAQTDKYPVLTTVQVIPARKGMVNISGSRQLQLKTKAAPARVGARRTRCRPGPSLLRFVVLAPEASLASVLQAVPARVPVESQAVALKFPSTLFAASLSDSDMNSDSYFDSNTGSNDPSPPRTVLALKSAVITETPSPRPVAAIPVIIVHPAPVLALSDASTNIPCTKSVSAAKTPVGRKRSGSFRGFKHAEMRSSISSKDKENCDVDKARFLRVSSAHRSAGALRS